MSLEVKNLCFHYGKRRILSDIGFEACSGELVSVMGPNGVGKTTLFRCILRLSTDYSGSISLDGQDTRLIGIRDMARHVAYIPQSHAPVFNFTVLDIVLMGTASQVSAVNNPGSKQISLAEAALEQLGIEHLRKRGYTQISGGERQLTLIARALAQNAKTLIMDEPTSSLDYGNQLRILSGIKKLTKSGYTILLSTHNPDHALMYSDRVLALKDGCVVQNGPPNETISGDLIRLLFDVEVDVACVSGDHIRVCLPKRFPE